MSEIKDNPDNWKVIPGYSRYEINEVGVVRKIHNKKVMKQWLRGNYTATAITSDNKSTSRIESIHILLCLTFIGPKPLPEPGHKLVTANHKDGNKLNNVRSNVEWLSNSGNILHAYKNRLNKSSQHLRLTNVVSGEVVDLHSYRELSKWMGNPNLRGRMEYLKYRNRLYQGQWRIELLGESEKSSGSRTSKQVCVMDVAKRIGLREGEFDTFIFNSMHDAAAALGVSRKGIGRSISTKGRHVVNGYAISLSFDDMVNVTYDKAYVEISLKWAKLRGQK
ncbi:putative HNH endonuclease [Erwinia phage vB_EamM_Mortimer]|uniref:Putative HNH homing endonuclease n=2 Tax=Agricanvirus TaxID=1984776 RepID=A0A191ZBY9_9CAUD|nr:putative HNH homing endonuclease [Erwinia phage vB_EamM_Special G]ANJ64902.1 putative HNH homing endonuclease [Erwinia phage vB_EamM_Special G]AUG86842.1 putative HNH endonuclease [Erwinia phage vB_EamM_Mortimer]